jgi:radical SAM superfamily enzyme with C-terminal helix-hairpin-helix motif
MHLRKTALLVLCFIFALSAHAEGILNANTASEESLKALSTLSDEQVGAILANRPYEKWADLNTELAKSLSAEELEELYGKLFVPLKLNSELQADFQLIPGVGKKMAHEFDEYRPYADMDQFRREIGKYVDADEVARYEQYVILD